MTQFNTDNLRSRQAVFEEAKRVAAIKRWAHLGGLYMFAHQMFDVTPDEMVKECDLGLSYETLRKYGRLAKEGAA